MTQDQIRNLVLTSEASHLVDLIEKLVGAVTWTLNRAQTDPDFRDMMVLTESHDRLCAAEAVVLGQPAEQVLERRRKDLQPSHRRHLPRRVEMQERLEHIRQAVERLEHGALERDEMLARLRGALSWSPKVSPTTVKIRLAHGPVMVETLPLDAKRWWKRLDGGPDDRWWTNGCSAARLAAVPPREVRSPCDSKWDDSILIARSQTPGRLTDGRVEDADGVAQRVDAGDASCWVDESYVPLLAGCELRCGGADAPVVGYVDGQATVVIMPVKL